MSDDATFTEFMQRIRAGDASAAEELVRRYEPAIRLEVKFRLRDSPLARSLDSMDICQSVLASFFVRTAAGQYDLERPEQLRALLVSMARTKLAFQARRGRAQRRDNRRIAGAPVDDLSAGGPSPSRVAAGRELLQALRNKLSPEERQIADLRGQGYTWDEIAQKLGGTSPARRKQFERAVTTAVQALGLEESDDE
jgi:RNA polymerase sigma-70 factor (ECF subfamily)